MIANNLLQHYKGYEDLIKHLDQAVNRYEKTYCPIALDFYSMDNLNVVKSYLGDNIEYSLIGGYPESLNKRVVIGSDINEADYVVCLRAKYNSKFNTLTHRDLQGTVYSLGIDICKFGDMWIDENYLYLYVVEELSSYVAETLTQIRHNKVAFEPVEFAVQEFKFAESRIIANSLRIDKIVSLIIRKSREKAKDFIDGQLVKVNYKTIEDCSFVCNNNDILSIRTYGRYKIDGISTNKSGNYVLTIKKFV